MTVGTDYSFLKLTITYYLPTSRFYYDKILRFERKNNLFKICCKILIKLQES